MYEQQRIDRTLLSALRKELGGSFGRVVEYFQEDGAAAVAAIEAAVRARDACALVRPAHKLKGEALQFGALPLGEAAERIEKAARQAVEDHVFPCEVIELAVTLRELYCETASLLMLETVPMAPSRRPTAGFGRKMFGTRGC